MLAADDVDLDGGVREALLLLGLCLVDDALRDEDLLDDLPRGGDIVVEQDAGGEVPTDPEHHDGHDERGHAHGGSLLTRLVAGHVELRDQREHREKDKRDEIRRRGGDALPPHGGRSGRQVGEDVVEREARALEVRGKVAQQREEGEEEGHLQKEREASTEGVELVLGVELLHLLALAQRIILVALLDLHELGLENLHARRRLGRLKHERRQDQADDQDQNDDRKAPVDREILDERQNLEQDVNDEIPHKTKSSDQIPIVMGRDQNHRHGADCIS